MKLSPIDTAFEGFRIIRERPGLVLAWTGFYLLCLLAMILILALPNLGIVTVVDPTAGHRSYGNLKSRFGVAIWVITPIAWTMFIMLIGAIYRSVIRPDESKFAYLRLGYDELRLLAIGATVIATFALLTAFVGVSWLFLSQLLSDDLGALTRKPAWILEQIIGVWTFIWLFQAGSMTFGDRKVEPLKAWKFTYRNFWPLLGSLAISVGLSAVVVALSLALSALIILPLGGFRLLSEVMAPDVSGISQGAALRGLALLAPLAAIQILQGIILFVVIVAPFARTYQASKAHIV